MATTMLAFSLWVALWPAARGDVLGMSQVGSERFPLVTPSGVEYAEAADRFVDIGPRAPDGAGGAAAIYEPHRGLCWWVYQETLPGLRPGIVEVLRSTAVLHAVDDQLVLFKMHGQELAVRAMSEHAENLEGCLQIGVNAIEQSMAGGEGVFGVTKMYKLVSLSGLSEDFFVVEGSAGFVLPKLVSVSLVDGKWDVTVKGPNGDEAVVTLNSTFDLEVLRRIQ